MPDEPEPSRFPPDEEDREFPPGSNSTFCQSWLRATPAEQVLAIALCEALRVDDPDAFFRGRPPKGYVTVDGRYNLVRVASRIIAFLHLLGVVAERERESA